MLYYQLILSLLFFRNIKKQCNYLDNYTVALYFIFYTLYFRRNSRS